MTKNEEMKLKDEKIEELTANEKSLLCLCIRVMKFHASFTPKTMESKTYKMINEQLKNDYTAQELKDFQEKNKDELSIEGM